MQNTIDSYVVDSIGLGENFLIKTYKVSQIFKKEANYDLQGKMKR